MKKIAKKLLQVDGRNSDSYEPVVLQPSFGNGHNGDGPFGNGQNSVAADAASESRPRRPSLGALLLQEGLVTDEQVKAALTEGLRTGERLGEVVVRKGWLTDERIAELLARQWQLRFLKTDALSIDPMAMRRIPLAIARELDAVPISFDAHGVLLAIAEPSDEMFTKVQERIGDASYVVIARSALDLLLASRLLASSAGKDEPAPGLRMSDPAPAPPAATHVATESAPAPIAPLDTAPVDETSVFHTGPVFVDEVQIIPEPTDAEPVIRLAEPVAPPEPPAPAETETAHWNEPEPEAVAPEPATHDTEPFGAEQTHEIEHEAEAEPVAYAWHKPEARAETWPETEVDDKHVAAEAEPVAAEPVAAEPETAEPEAAEHDVAAGYDATGYDSTGHDTGTAEFDDQDDETDTEDDSGSEEDFDDDEDDEADEPDDDEFAAAEHTEPAQVHAMSTMTDPTAVVDGVFRSIDTARAELKVARGELANVAESLALAQRQLTERESQLEEAEVARERDAETIRKLQAELAQRAGLFETLREQVSKLHETVDTVVSQ